MSFFTGLNESLYMDLGDKKGYYMINNTIIYSHQLKQKITSKF